MSEHAERPGFFDCLTLIGWLAFTFCASFTAVFVDTGGWYAELAKPVWNPPSWVFAPVWTTLYVTMAVSAWLVWLRGGWRQQKAALLLYVVQWMLNACWTPLFFGLHRLDWAFAELLVLLVAVIATMIVFWRVRRSAGILLAPYAVWVAFAALLNLTIWRMNA